MAMDDIYMQQALGLAVKGRGRTSPNPMVGAVIVKDGSIIGQGYHQKAGTPHAEVHALQEADGQAKDATLYVTLEPCVHYGRTPPCTDAIIRSGIKRVVIAAQDSNPLVAGRGVKTLRDAGIAVTTGVMEKEAVLLNEVFNKFITTRKPFVVLKSAMSLDGKIATYTGQSQWITGTQARQYGHRLRDTYDAILVGIGTILADNPLLTTRLATGEGRNPMRIILDSTGRTPLSSNVLVDKSATTIVVVTEAASQERVEAIEATGAKVLVLPAANNRVDFSTLVTLLGQRNITSILIEGGAAIHGAALQAQIVDKVHFFIAPKIIGGHEAPGPVGGQGIAILTDAVKLTGMCSEKIGEDIHIQAYVKKGNEACLQDL
jgi:diaminohydroxyphosphoribosylaminopyrimidine deaminase / 5-amino-6-(5-phosphoribosylamino)uracil reductase